MDDRERMDILAEILRERASSTRHVLDEWSVPHADPLTYAQAKDLIWQIAAPLGLSMLGFSAAERVRRDDPGDPDIQSALAGFARTGEETGRLMERLLRAAAGVQP